MLEWPLTITKHWDRHNKKKALLKRGCYQERQDSGFKQNTLSSRASVCLPGERPSQGCFIWLGTFLTYVLYRPLQKPARESETDSILLVNHQFAVLALICVSAREFISPHGEVLLVVTHMHAWCIYGLDYSCMPILCFTCNLFIIRKWFTFCAQIPLCFIIPPVYLLYSLTLSLKKT